MSRPPRRPSRPSRPAARGPGEGLGGGQIEGRQAVRELLRARRRRVHDVWLAEGTDPAPILNEIEELALGAGVPVRRVPRARLAAMAHTEVPQGVIAHADALPVVDLDELARPVAGAAPFLVVFDGVTDPHNLGAVLRTAACAGATGAVLPRHRSAHITAAVAKAAAGAVEYLALSLVGGIPGALLRLGDLGVWTVGLAPDGDRSVFALDVADGPVALVLGAEGTGLSRLARARCDVLAAIPQPGPIGSLNVAAAAAVACYAVLRSRSD